MRIHDRCIINAKVLSYLRRLSDVLFVLARHEEAQEGHESRPSRG